MEIYDISKITMMELSQIILLSLPQSSGIPEIAVTAAGRPEASAL